MLLFFGYAFLLLVAYYIVRTLREPLLLVHGSAELKTYASAAAALALLLLVPLYGVAFRRVDKNQLARWVTGLFVGTLGALYLAARSGLDIGFVYYVWAGIFGITIVAQFWAHAADCLSKESGSRLFPVIMTGATLGGLAGPSLFRVLHGALDAPQLMLVAMAVLALTLPFVEWTRNSVPTTGRSNAAEPAPSVPRPLGGFSLVLRDRYLLLLALFVVLLNCVNTMGEYLLADVVVRHVDNAVAMNPSLDKGELIGTFYANFSLVMNALTMLTQMFLVARVFRWIGVNGALLVLPAVAVIGYGLVAVLPIVGLLRVVKVIENSGNYSLLNTARQALYLPLPTAGKYEGKMATDTFFWRFGDLLPAAIVFVGASWLHFEPRQFALLNVGLSLAWLAVAVRLAALRPEPPTDRLAAPLARRVGAARQRSPWIFPTFGLAKRASACCAVAIGVLTLAGSGRAHAATPDGTVPLVSIGLFDEQPPLSMELVFDARALCRKPANTSCEDLPATLAYRDALGDERRVTVTLRTRGRYRADTVECGLPALFVFFTGDTRDTLFAGESMLPLTTHCKRSAEHEQYVLKEYLAYRLYNALTSKSLRARLVRVTYRDSSGRIEPFERYAFFTEHFDSYARRHGVTVRAKKPFDPLAADPTEIATLDLFEYLIGNTDWSAVYGHNVLLVENESGLVTPVPFDFDFSGLVNAAYATVSPVLPTRGVRTRVFRGVCRADTDWATLFAHFGARRDTLVGIANEIVDLEPRQRSDVLDYLNGAFATFESSQRRDREIINACRRP